MENKTIPGMGFHHIGLKAKDFEKSLRFYEALGMTKVVEWGEGKNHIAMLDLGDGGRIELFADGGDEFSENGKWVHFAMRVEDVDAAYATALAAGAVSQTPPCEVPLDAQPAPITIRIAFVKGPDGEVLEFFKQL